MADKRASDEEGSSVVMVTPPDNSTKSESVAAGSVKADDDQKDSDGNVKADDDKQATEKDNDKKVIIGMVCGTKDLYQKRDQHQPNKFTWTDKYPEDLEEAAENEETIKYAILVRNKKSYDSRKKLEIDSIVIQSPLLKHVLHTVLKDYPGVTTTLQRLVFAAPFRPFVHRWAELTAARNDPTLDEATRTHVGLLHDVLAPELGDVISAMADYVANKVVTYEHVWTIFQPGSVVLGSRYGRPVAMRLSDGEFVQHCKLGPAFRLTCDRVDWDGSKFGLEECESYILPFLGTTAIDTLACCPLEYHPDPEGTRQALVARGRAFEALAGYHYRSYRGVAIEQKKWGPSKVSVDSRIVVDAFAHAKWNPNHQVSLKSLSRLEHKARAAQLDDDSDDGERNSDAAEFFHQRYSYGEDEDRADDLVDETGARPAVPLAEDQLLLCVPTVRGWALKAKKWLEFYIDDVSPVRFDERAFDSLVLPGDQKALILAFARGQARSRALGGAAGQEDVIAGKGRGVIMLLSGGPGIGKTLTAEAVAETMGVPLYSMSADDMGDRAYEVESNLATVLDMVGKWNAVLLLDECDIVLERRTSEDLDRNRIVGIFLRMLEYYEGILFLTTNRVECMDEAFFSRIHMCLEYPSLDLEARTKVWSGFLERQSSAAKGEDGQEGVGGHSVSDEEVAKLAVLEINGRQIRNTLKTSNLLAHDQGEKLGYRHIKTVLEVGGHKVE